MICHRTDTNSCLVFLLRRGGRTISACHAQQLPDGFSILSAAGTLRVASGGEALGRIAAVSLTPREAAAKGDRMDLAQLRVYGRARWSRRLMSFKLLRKPRTATSAGHPWRGLLQPEFDIADASPLADGEEQDLFEGEQLF